MNNSSHRHVISRYYYGASSQVIVELNGSVINWNIVNQVGGYQVDRSTAGAEQVNQLIDHRWRR